MKDRSNDPIEAAKAANRRGWRFYLACTLATLGLIFVLQNTDDTRVTFLFAETDLPLFFALIIAIGLGAAIGWLTPVVRRNRDDVKKED